MKIVPLGDKLVIRRESAEEKTAGGIVLPDSAKEAPQQGRVLAVGDGPQLPDGSRASHEVKEGDRVIFGAYGGTEVSIDDEELLILRADEVLAVLR